MTRDAEPLIVRLTRPLGDPHDCLPAYISAALASRRVDLSRSGIDAEMQRLAEEAFAQCAHDFEG
ncbi:MAG: hypothetical protein FWD12_12165 [Alphaproteobacteria bacterium]|nr:hypothetical protein [Alphaproteobacteria bacterium]